MDATGGSGMLMLNREQVFARLEAYVGKKRPVSKPKTRTGLNREDTRGHMIAQKTTRKRQQKQMHKKSGKR
jgi:hypothetical protein